MNKIFLRSIIVFIIIADISIAADIYANYFQIGETGDMCVCRSEVVNRDMGRCTIECPIYLGDQGFPHPKAMGMCMNPETRINGDFIFMRPIHGANFEGKNVPVCVYYRWNEQNNEYEIINQLQQVAKVY